MSFYYTGCLALLLLFCISSHGVLGVIKLPTCHCECCPGEDCSAQLVVFSVDYCNETTCSLEQCHRMYPKKCGLYPGLTKPYCNISNRTITTTRTTVTTKQSSYIPFSYDSSNGAGSSLFAPFLIFFSGFLNFI